MFEQFNDDAIRVVKHAEEEARTLKHSNMGAEHLLLGLLREPVGTAAAAFAHVGLTLQAARESLIAEVGLGEHVTAGEIPPTAGALLVTRSAEAQARSAGHDLVGPEDLLLALTRQPSVLVASVLEAAGTDAEEIHDATIKRLPAPLPGQTPKTRDRLEAVPTHGDRPSRTDELERTPLAEVLAERLRRVRGEDTEYAGDNRRARWRKLRADQRAAIGTGAFMVHVHAPWGAGKSSFLDLLAIQLRNSEHTPGDRRLTARSRRRAASPSLSQWIVVEFNAWRHQRLNPPWWWLLAQVRRSCAAELWHIGRIEWARFWVRDLAWRAWNSRTIWISAILIALLVVIAEVFDWFGVHRTSLTTLKAGALSISALLALATATLGYVRGTSRWLAIGSASAASKFLQKAEDPLGVYRRRFRWLVRSAGRPIAVFIDDLDRCSTDYVVELLEGIQNLFSDEPVTYVVAADRLWICRCFASRYADFSEASGDVGRPLGFLFMEKTFQLSMELPPLSGRTKERYWQRLASGRASVERTVPRARPDLTQTFEGVRTQEQIDSRVAMGVASEISEDDLLLAAVRRLNAPDMQAQLDRSLSRFGSLVENNPRAMKRLVNAYGLERDRLLREGYESSRWERDQLVLLTILRLRWPLLADHLLESPQDVRFCLRTVPPPDHPYARLFAEPEVRRLFDDTYGRGKLSAAALTRYGQGWTADLPTGASATSPGRRRRASSQRSSDEQL